MRNDLLNFGVEGALGSGEGTLVLGELSDSLFKVGDCLGTCVINHGREVMKAPKMIATKLKDNELISHELEARRLPLEMQKENDLLNIILCFFHSF